MRVEKRTHSRRFIVAGAARKSEGNAARYRYPCVRDVNDLLIHPRAPSNISLSFSLKCTKYEGSRDWYQWFSLQPSVMLKIWTEEFLSVSILAGSFFFFFSIYGRVEKHCAPDARGRLCAVTSGLPFFQTISRLDPKFIALHCQEVGGKNYEQSMRHVEDFVR